MKIETILNALMRVNNNLVLVGPLHHKHLANLRQYPAFRDRIIRMVEEKDQMIWDMAYLAYGDQVEDTGMVEHLIGGDNEYADREDWMNSYIEGLRETSG